MLKFMRSPRAVLSNVNPVRTKRSLLNIHLEDCLSYSSLFIRQVCFSIFMVAWSVEPVRPSRTSSCRSSSVSASRARLFSCISICGHICNQISKNIHLRVQTHSSNCTKNPSEHEQLKSKTQIKEKTCRKPSSCRVEHVDHMCRGVITGSVR